VLISSTSAAYAKTNDQLYVDAYNATFKATQFRNQASVNESRKAIDELRGKADWAIGEFSKQTDAIQQSLFEEFMRLLFRAGGAPKDYVPQSDVNRAKELVINFDTYEGNKPYTASWSSAVDKYQQKLIDDIVKLVENAEKTKKSIDVDSAKLGINSLLTEKNNKDVIDFASKLLERVNAIKVEDGNSGNVGEGNIYDYKNYIKAELDSDGDVEFKVKYEELWSWQRGGFVSPQHDVDNILKYVDYFKNGDYYKGMSPYACVFKRDHMLPSGQENYSEIVRLVDGKVLIRVWKSGKIEEFAPIALTKDQVETYKNSSYEQMLEKLK